MTIVTRTTAKSYFELGDKPTQSEFGDFIDSALFQEDVSTFGKALVSASTTASAQNLLGVGAVGRNLFETVATASAQSGLGGGVVGRQVFEAITTASARFVIEAQGSAANLTALSGLNGSANKIPYFTGVGTMSLIDSFSNRNLLINGGMAIDQRNAGASQTITAAAALAYTVDRWYSYCTGANVTGQRVSGTSPNQYNYQFTGAASVTKIGFAQRIEAANSQHLAGNTATLSVDLANSLLTTVTWTAWYANTNDTFGTLASPTRTQIATGTFTVSSTLTRFNTNISIPSAATTGIEIEFSVAAQTSGTWTIGRAQIELGSVATTFDYLPTQSVTSLCQRYYEKTYNLEVKPATNTNAGARTIGFQNLLGNGASTQFYWQPFLVRKRAAPSISLYSTAGNIGFATQDDNSEIASSTGNIGETGFYSSSINTAGRYLATQHFVAISEL